VLLVSKAWQHMPPVLVFGKRKSDSPFLSSALIGRKYELGRCKLLEDFALGLRRAGVAERG